MLSACELSVFVSPIRVVSFRQVFGLPFPYVESLIRRQSPRLRLNPPYREHLGSSVCPFHYACWPAGRHTPLQVSASNPQYRIVAEVERRLSVVQEVEDTVTANLKRAERLRQSILKRAFEGRLVPQDPNDELGKRATGARREVIELGRQDSSCISMRLK